MRRFLLESIAQKPSVGYIQIDFFRGPPQGWQPVQVLDQHHLEQHHRVHTGPSVIFAVQWCHHFIYAVKIHCRVYFPQ